MAVAFSDPSMHVNHAEHPDDGRLLTFESEAQAVEYTARRLAPFCRKLTREAEIGEGLRPDLVIRLIGLHEFPLAVEVKRFVPGGCTPFPEAIRQAASYARKLETAAFIAPLAGRGAMRFQWNLSPIGSGLLVAGQFGVGGVYFAHERYQDRPVGGLILAGAQVASLLLDGGGNPIVQWNNNAAHLLKLKQGYGSRSWRER